MSALDVVADAAVAVEKKEVQEYEVQVHASSCKSEPDGSLECLEKGGELSCAVYCDGAVVTRKELWSYYLYMNGNCGVVPFIYMLTFFQSLLTAAGYDPVAGPGSPCNTSSSAAQCVIPWGSGTKAVSSVVLIANSICFAIMTFTFTTVSAAADYGNVGRWLLIIATVICWASQFACMALTSPSRWPIAFVLYVVNFTSYGATLVFYMAIFPRLARYTAYTLEMRDKLITGQASKQEYDVEESMEKNRISNMSMVHYTIGFTVVACLNLALLIPLHDHPLVDNYSIVMMTVFSVLIGGWWFVFQQHRPGPPLPEGESYFTIGWKQIWSLRKECRKLPHLFIFLVAFFLLSDGFNTTGTLTSVMQNEKVDFSFLQGTYLGLGQAIPSIVGTWGSWRIQKRWKISTKTMFAITNVATIIIPLWGMLGIWTDKIGFHSLWEFWAYNVVFGLFQAPYFAFSQTMMAELSPPGFDYLFFGIFGLSNRASSMIGPNVVQAIVNQTGSNWMGFPFLFALCTAASLMIWFGVDVPRGREDARRWALERRRAEGKGGVESADSG